MQPSPARRLAGHFWTIAPFVVRAARPEAPPPSEPWVVDVPDAKLGTVRLRGWLSTHPRADELLVVVHGLGGSSGSHYVVTAARAAWAANVSCLRLDLRGAAGSCPDFYHAGLSDDLAEVIASPSFERYRAIYVLGYSIGGHLALHYASRDDVSARVRVVAAISPPLDLDLSAKAIDRPELWVYREHVLRGLREMVSAVARQRPIGIDARGLAAIKRLRDWDDRVVAPRFAFRSAEHYYAEMSVGPRLARLAVPTLLVEAEADPMVPADTLRPSLANAPRQLDVRWVPNGGHVGFAGSLDLGYPGPRGLVPQVLSYMRATSGARRDQAPGSDAIRLS